VWLGTEMIGIAIAWTETHYVVIVVYYPSGNEIEKYTKNVFEPTSTDQEEPLANN